MNNSFSSFGLRTKETDKFCRFFSIVQNKAEAENKVFFLDSGEGRELLTDELEGEDLSGWLIPKDKAAFFEILWKKMIILMSGLIFLHLPYGKSTTEK